MSGYLGDIFTSSLCNHLRILQKLPLNRELMNVWLLLPLQTKSAHPSEDHLPGLQNLNLLGGTGGAKELAGLRITNLVKPSHSTGKSTGLER